MDLSAIYEIVGMVGTVVATGGALWSRRAAKLSKPTGNGFATTVLTHLTEIRTELRELRSRTDDIEDRLDRERRPEPQPARG